MPFTRGSGAATGSGRPAPRRPGTRPGPGTAAPASGAATRRLPGARWTARPARAVPRPGSRSPGPAAARDDEAPRVATGRAAAEVARRCGCLPLALQIAGAKLAARPTWPVRAPAARLADARRGLDELELPEVGVRASFAVTSEQLQDSGEPLDRAAAAAFGLLGVLDGPELGVPVAARLLDQPEETAERVLERLVDAQLLETLAAGRYRMHDLLRLYAREQAARRFPAAECAAALTRAFGLYAATAWRTLALLRPGDHRLARADDRWRAGWDRAPPEPAAALAWSDWCLPYPRALAGPGVGQPGRPRGRAPDGRPERRGADPERPRLRPSDAGALCGGGRLPSAEPDHPPGARRPSRPVHQPEQPRRHSPAAGTVRAGALLPSREHGRPPRAGNPHGQAESLRELGRTLRAHGDHESARAHWREALAIFERLHTTAADEVRALLAEGA